MGTKASKDWRCDNCDISESLQRSVKISQRHLHTCCLSLKGDLATCSQSKTVKQLFGIEAKSLGQRPPGDTSGHPVSFFAGCGSTTPSPPSPRSCSRTLCGASSASEPGRMSSNASAPVKSRGDTRTLGRRPERNHFCVKRGKLSEFVPFFLGGGRRPGVVPRPGGEIGHVRASAASHMSVAPFWTARFMFTLCERRTERRRLRLGSQGEWKDISVA